MVKFTVNLCVIDKAQYSEAQEERRATFHRNRRRISAADRDGGSDRGRSSFKRHDLWWSLREGIPLPLLPNKSFWLLRRMVCRPCERGCSSCGSEKG